MGCQVAAGAAGPGLTPDTTDAGSSRLRAVARWVATGGSFAAGHVFAVGRPLVTEVMPDQRRPDPVVGAARSPLGSVVIPAHNESAASGAAWTRCSPTWTPGELEVVVVCNGCADDTAALARSSGHPVRVIEFEAASKPAALRAGDELARALPRIYLDADVVLLGSAARSRAGAPAGRRGRRATADSIRERRLVGASPQLLSRPLARAGTARIPVGRRRLRPLRGWQEPLRRVPGRRRRRPMGGPAVRA